jgi:hypothetical protein
VGGGRADPQPAEPDRHADRHFHDRSGADHTGVELRAVRPCHVGRGGARAGISPDHPAGRGERGEVGGSGGPVAGDEARPDEHPRHADQGEHAGEGQHPDGRGPAIPGTPPAAHPPLPGVPGSRAATASADTSMASGSGPSGVTSADTVT